MPTGPGETTRTQVGWLVANDDQACQEIVERGAELLGGSIGSGISAEVQTALDAKLDDIQKGAPNGLAELDEDGLVPADQLPDFGTELADPGANGYYHQATGGSPSIRGYSTVLNDIGAVPAARTISPGVGLSGGGDLSADRTLALDINGLTELSGSADGLADFVPIYDASGSVIRKVKPTNLVSAGAAVPLVEQAQINQAVGAAAVGLPSFGVVTVSSSALTADRLLILPYTWQGEDAVAITKLRIYVTVGVAASTLKAAIYEVSEATDADTAPGWIGTQLWIDNTGVATTGAAMAVFTVTGVTMTKWKNLRIALLPSHAISVRQATALTVNPGMGFESTGLPIRFSYKVAIGGSIPVPPGKTSFTADTTSATPLVLLGWD